MIQTLLRVKDLERENDELKRRLAAAVTYTKHNEDVEDPCKCNHCEDHIKYVRERIEGKGVYRPTFHTEEQATQASQQAGSDVVVSVYCQCGHGGHEHNEHGFCLGIRYPDVSGGPLKPMRLVDELDETRMPAPCACLTWEPAAPTEGGPAVSFTARDLLNSGAVGLWKHRTDIEDSAEFIAELRERDTNEGG